MHSTVLTPADRLPPAGKLQQRMLTAANVCTTIPGRLLITDNQQYLVDTGSNLCVFPRQLLSGRWERTNYTLYAANGNNTSTRPSARCGTSHSTGPSPTGVTAIPHASPENRLHRRTHSSAASPDPHASLDNRLHRRTHSSAASPDPRASPDNTLHRRTHLSAASPDPHASPDNRLHRRTHSSAASPDPCTTPDNQLPRTDPLACSSTGPLCAATPTVYPGTQTPVAGRQRHITPAHSAAVAQTQHDSSSPPAQPFTAPAKPEPPSQLQRTTRSGRTVHFPARFFN
jgi:hypothetical protein